MSNSTSATTPRTTQPGDLTFSSPVTVLPLVAALVTIVGIFVGACFVYHRRQRKRTQELVRQLRVTERRIDAIGVLTAKKQQALAAKKAEYFPPVAAPCSSVSTMGISNVYTTQLPRSEMPETQLSVPSSTTYDGQEKTFTVTVQLNENCPVTDECESKLDTNNTSYYCSTCKLEESNSESVLAQYRVATDNINSSMAVECATIPAVSSLSTVYSTKRDSHKVHNKAVKRKSELHKKTLRNQLSKQSLRLMRGLGLASSSNSTESSENRTTAQLDILPRRSLEQDARRMHSMGKGARRSMEPDFKYSDTTESKGQDNHSCTGQDTLSYLKEHEARYSMEQDSTPRRSVEPQPKHTIECDSTLRRSIGPETRHSMEPKRHLIGQHTVTWSSGADIVTYIGETTPSESEVSVLGGGTPNSPATTRDEASEVTMTDGTTDTEGRREKWV